MIQLLRQLAGLLPHSRQYRKARPRILANLNRPFK